MNFRGIWRESAVALTILVLAGVTSAQEPAVTPSTQGGPDVFYRTLGPGPGGDFIGFVEFEMSLDHQVVKGAPFTASFSRHTTQTLADGNTIDRTTTGNLARDSEGRTQRDVTLPAIGAWAASGTAPQAVFINDPVAGVHYILHPDRKVARKIPPPPGSPGVLNSGRIQKFAEAWQKETTTVSLGTQTMEGLAVEGTRTTRTIPPGEIGNAKAIEIVTEKWYSPDLQTYVMTKHTDPRVGETVFQLTNIKRRDPPAPLQVPADYTITEGGPGHRQMGRHVTP